MHSLCMIEILSEKAVPRVCSVLSTCSNFCSASHIALHLSSTVSPKRSAKSTVALLVLHPFPIGESGTLSSFSNCSSITSTDKLTCEALRSAKELTTFRSWLSCAHIELCRSVVPTFPMNSFSSSAEVTSSSLPNVAFHARAQGCTHMHARER